MTDISAQRLLTTQAVTVRDVHCRGRCRHRGPEECASALQLVFPYRGVYVRHLGGIGGDAVAEANQIVVFNPAQGYRVSHPVGGGDASLSITLAPALIAELAPRALVAPGPELALRAQGLRIDARTQALVALVRHGLHEGTVEPLEAESLTITLVARALGPRTAHARGGSAGRQRLVDRAKLVLAQDLSRRWTLAEIAREVGASPVYLTQTFQTVEGMPLYRYQLRMRLARALDLLGTADDLSALAAELGFSSHSHFSAAFRQCYRQSPSAFRRTLLR